MSNQKLATLIFTFIVVIMGIAVYFGVIRHQTSYASSQPLQIDGVVLPQPREIVDFNLVDNHGQPFTKENLKGRWTMVFFGFTNCGLVCPTTLAALSKMYQTLQQELPNKQLPGVVMISVDPERDTVSRMNDYVKAFNPNFIGARADIRETVALEKELHIAAAKIQVDGQGKDHYTIDHSAEILLFNPKGQLRAYFSYPHTPEQMVKDYKLIIKSMVS